MAVVAVPAKCGEIYVDVLLNEDDAKELGGRRLSIGSHGYAQLWEGGRTVLLHRWLMGIPVGTRYRVIVDHINRDRLDCRRENLRVVTPSASNLNREVRARDLPRGVYRVRNKRFVAKIKRHRRESYLGTFDTPEEAAAVVEAVRQVVDADAFVAVPDEVRGGGG